MAKKKTAEDYADQIATHIMLGTKIPNGLMNKLMKVVCEEEKQKQQGSKPSSSEGPVGEAQ